MGILKERNALPQAFAWGSTPGSQAGKASAAGEVGCNSHDRNLRRTVFFASPPDMILCRVRAPIPPKRRLL